MIRKILPFLGNFDFLLREYVFEENTFEFLKKSLFLILMFYEENITLKKIAGDFFFNFTFCTYLSYFFHLSVKNNISASIYFLYILVNIKLWKLMYFFFL